MAHTRVAAPLQRPYAWFWLGTMLIRLPWWMVTNLTPAQRPRRSWSFKKAVLIRFIRAWLIGVERTYMKLGPAPPDHRKLVLSKGVLGLWVDAAPELVTGKVKDWAEKAGVEAIRLPGYWLHKEGSNLSMGQKPVDEKEKVVYFLHGGGYTMLSAHTSDPCTNITHGLLEYCPSVQRAFSIEYRLCTLEPEPTAGQFPSQLIDAITGYNYLVNEVGVAPSQIIIAGNSAGANLAQALTRYLVEYKGTIPKLPEAPSALIFLSPWADLSGSNWAPNSSYITNAKHDSIQLFDKPYAIDAPPSFIEPFGPDIVSQTPYISPACKTLEDVNFDGFPKTFINAGDAEVLLDQIRELSRRMKDKMGEDKVVYFEGKDAWHDYLSVFFEPERSTLLKAIAAFVEEPSK